MPLNAPASSPTLTLEAVRRPASPGYAVVYRGRVGGAVRQYPPAVPVTQGLRDDLRQHVDNILAKLATITLVLVAVTAYLDRNTSYNSSRDYLVMICLSTGLVVLVECFAHLRHRKQLPAGRVTA